MTSLKLEVAGKPVGECLRRARTYAQTDGRIENTLPPAACRILWAVEAKLVGPLAYAAETINHNLTTNPNSKPLFSPLLHKQCVASNRKETCRKWRITFNERFERQ